MAYQYTEEDKIDAIKQIIKTGFNYNYLPEALKEDRRVAIAAINENSAQNIVVDHLPSNLKADIHVALHTAQEMEKVQTQGFTREIFAIAFTRDINDLIEPGKSVSESLKSALSPEQRQVDSDYRKELATIQGKPERNPHLTPSGKIRIGLL